MSALPGQPLLSERGWCLDSECCSAEAGQVSLRLGWEAGAGLLLLWERGLPWMSFQEGNIHSAPKGHMAGFAPADSKKETCTQLDQLSCNIGGESESQTGRVTLPRLQSQLRVEPTFSLMS